MSLSQLSKRPGYLGGTCKRCLSHSLWSFIHTSSMHVQTSVDALGSGISIMVGKLQGPTSPFKASNWILVIGV